MSTKPLMKPPTVSAAAPSVVETPTEEETAAQVFAPSAELGEQLQQLEGAQVEIDRRKAEELAQLREIQDRD